MSLDEIMNGMSTSSLWSALSLPPVNDQSLKKKHLRAFVYWLFNNLLVSLLKCNFYLTESVVHRNRTLYFRQDSWRRLTAKAWEKVKKNALEAMSDAFDPCVNRQNLGVCRIRMIPKETGYRPVMNLRRALFRGKNGSKASINSILRNLHAILDYHRTSDPGLLGASVMGMDQVYQRWICYRSRIQKCFVEGDPTRQQGSGPLYFVKFDIKACFDSIPHDLLFQIISNILKRVHCIFGYFLVTFRTII